MAEAIVSGVVTRLGDFLVQEGQFLSGVSNQVELLRTELLLMQGIIWDADARRDESEIIRQWVAEIRDLASDADNLIEAYVLKVKSRREKGIKKALKRCACILCEGITVHKFESQIEDTRAKISILSTNFRDLIRFGIGESMIRGISGPGFNQRQLKQIQYRELDIIGFDDDANKLVEFLLKEGEGRRVASICGIGGMGKTTLAKMVYNHPQVKQHFDHRSWLCIPEQYQNRNVLKGILFSLVKLNQVQKKEKCLVVLDGIWNFEAWNILNEAFPKDTGSKILITTRDREVALHIDPRGFHHELQFLNEEMSWELLEKTAISWRENEDSATKTYIKNLGKEMIIYCGGLPLATTVLGGLLATKQTQDEWVHVLKHIKSYILEGDSLQVNKVSALSYNHLPHYLKPCFLYFGLFPKDFEIPTKELIQMWMAEGFIPEIRDEGGIEDKMEDVGACYLRELVERCMVLVGERDSLGRIKTCRMHDLMQDFCLSKAQENNFLHITNIHSMEAGERHIGRIQRLAINWESGDNSLVGIKFNEYPYLRSLLYFVFRGNDIYFKESFLNKFKLVRVLSLENLKKNDGKLPNHIGVLIHLRFLSLKNSNIKNVPSSMGKLSCLQTLDLRVQSFRKRMPNVFNRMKQLRHLYLPQDYEVSEKLELANLCSLQTLVNVKPQTIRNPTSFRFNNLRVLGLGTYYSEWDQDTIQIVSKDTCPHIYKLSICTIIKKLPEAHQFSPNLAKLTLRGTNLSKDPMPTLEKLPNLKILNLFRKAFVGKTMVCSEGGFPLLQSLVLLDLAYLEEWSVKERAMPNLLNLKIGYCWSLKTISDGLSFIKTLQELEIKYMPKSFKDIIDKGGPDFYKVQHVPSLVFEHCYRE